MTPGKTFLSSDEIRSFNGCSYWWGLWLVVHCWGVIVLALVGFAWWLSVLTFVLAVMIIGSRQLGMAFTVDLNMANARSKRCWTMG